MPYKDPQKAIEARKRHYLTHRAKYLERARNQPKDPEKTSKHNRTYYLKNREALLAKMKLRDRKKPKPTPTFDPEKVKHYRDKMLKRYAEIQGNRNKLIAKV
jgi:hypothetical protein